MSEYIEKQTALFRGTERLRAENERLRAALSALLDHASATVLHGWRDEKIFAQAAAALAQTE